MKDTETNIELEKAVEKVYKKDVLTTQVGIILGKLALVIIILIFDQPDSFADCLYYGFNIYGVMTILFMLANFFHNWFVAVIAFFILLFIMPDEWSTSFSDGVIYSAMALVILIDLIRVIRLIVISNKKPKQASENASQTAEQSIPLNQPQASQQSSGFDFFSGCNDIDSLNKRFDSLRKMYITESGTSDEENLKQIDRAYRENMERLLSKNGNKV